MKKYEKLISEKLIKKAIRHYKKEGDADMLIWELEAILKEN